MNAERTTTQPVTAPFDDPIVDFDYNQWLQSPDGQEAQHNLQTGEWSEHDFYFILERMGEMPYADAKKQMGIGPLPTARRIGHDLGAAPGEIAKGGQVEEFKTWAGDISEKSKEHAVTKHIPGKVGPVSLGAAVYGGGEIFVSSLRALVEGSVKIGRGHANLGEMLDVVTVVAPFAKMANIGRVMMGSTMRTAVRKSLTPDMQRKGWRSIIVSKEQIEQALTDPKYGPMLAAELKKLEKVGKVFDLTHTGFEGLNLVVQNEEFFMELIGAGQFKVLGAVGSAAMIPKRISQSISTGMREGSEQLGREMREAPDWTPPGGATTGGATTGGATTGGATTGGATTGGATTGGATTGGATTGGATTGGATTGGATTGGATTGGATPTTGTSMVTTGQEGEGTLEGDAEPVRENFGSDLEYFTAWGEWHQGKMEAFGEKVKSADAEDPEPNRDDYGDDLDYFREWGEWRKRESDRVLERMRQQRPTETETEQTEGTEGGEEGGTATEGETTTIGTEGGTEPVATEMEQQAVGAYTRISAALEEWYNTAKEGDEFDIESALLQAREELGIDESQDAEFRQAFVANIRANQGGIDPYFNELADRVDTASLGQAEIDSIATEYVDMWRGNPEGERVDLALQFRRQRLVPIGERNEQRVWDAVTRIMGESSDSTTDGQTQTEGEQTEDVDEGKKDYDDSEGVQTLTEAMQEKYTNFDEAFVGPVENRDSIEVELVDVRHGDTTYSVYNGGRYIGGIMISRETHAGGKDMKRVFAADPKRTAAEAKAVSTHTSMYFNDEYWWEDDTAKIADAHYPTFNTIKEMLDYMASVDAVAGPGVVNHFTRDQTIESLRENARTAPVAETIDNMFDVSHGLDEVDGEFGANYNPDTRAIRIAAGTNETIAKRLSATTGQADSQRGFGEWVRFLDRNPEVANHIRERAREAMGDALGERLSFDEAKRFNPDLFTEEFIGEERQSDSLTFESGMREKEMHQFHVFLNGEMIGNVWIKPDGKGGLERNAQANPGSSYVNFETLDAMVSYMAQTPDISSMNRLDLVDSSKADTKVGAKRIFRLDESDDVEATVTKGNGIYQIVIDSPRFDPKEFEVKNTNPLTTDNARQAVRDLMMKGEIKSAKWTRNLEHRRFREKRFPIEEAEQAIIDQMPPVFEAKKKMRDRFTKGYDGLAFNMPAIDPALRVKTVYEGEGQYTVYVESDGFAAEMGDSTLRKLWVWQEFKRKSGKSPATIQFQHVEGASPSQAVQRVLADMLPGDIWDQIVEDPETGVLALKRKGIPGNQPQALGWEGHLGIAFVEENEGVRTYQISSGATGEIVPITDYSVTMRDSADGILTEMTVSFPNHAHLEPVTTEVYTNRQAPEGASTDHGLVFQGLARLMEKTWDDGGIRSSMEETQSTSAPEAVDMFEDPDPIIPSTEKSFGKMTIDKTAMKFQEYAMTGKVKIYKFAADHAPEVTVRPSEAEPDMYEVEVRYPRRNSAIALVHTSEAKNVPAIAKVGLKRVEESGHEFKPLHKAGMFFELDAMQNAINRRQFATTGHIERRVRGTYAHLRRGHKLDLRGYTISSLKELAVIGQILRHPFIEADRMFYLDENRRIITHETTSVGIPGTTGEIDYSRIRQTMRDVGASYIVDLHNHPMTPSSFSGQSGDKGAYNQLRNEFGSQYLGSDTVNSGEHSTAINTGKQMVYKERIRFTKEELGWDPGVDDVQPYASDPRKTNMRPFDPLYQYDILTPLGGLNELSQESGQVNVQKKNQMSTEEALQLVRATGKYLQTEENWTTLMFKGIQYDLISAVDYKDLHLLTPSQLQTLIETEAKRWGAIQVDAFVGKGDWYSSMSDIKNNSPWGDVLRLDQKTSAGYATYPRGVQFSWFEGLAEMEGKKENAYDETGVYRADPGREIGMGFGYPKSPYGHPTGRIVESQIDSEVGKKTGLVEHTPKRQGFIDKIVAAITGGTAIDVKRVYRELFDDYEMSDIPLKSMTAKELGIKSFAQAVINRVLLDKKISPNKASPQEAVDAYNELKGITERIFADSQMVNGKLEYGMEVASSDADGLRAHRAYTMARLARIDANDHVLTVNDQEGTLATMARNSDAGVVETIHHDNFYQALVDGVANGSVDKIHNIDYANLAREYRGNRPSVVMISGGAGFISMIDESLKVLSPEGRLVAYSGSSRGLSPDQITQIAIRYKVTEIKQGFSGGVYYVIDKQPIGTLGSFESFQTATIDNMASGTINDQKIFESVQKVRENRAPLTETAAQPFEGAAQTDEIFDQSIVHPDLPKGMEHGTESVGLPPEDASVGQRLPTPDEVRPVTPAADAEAAGLFRIADEVDMAEAEREPGLSVEDNSMGIPVQMGLPTPDDVRDKASGIISRIRRSTRSGLGWYSWTPRTGKMTLEKMGFPGKALLASLKRVRNFKEDFGGHGQIFMEDLFGDWNEYIKNYSKKSGKSRSEAARQLNEDLVRHQEGRDETEPPAIVKKIVKEMTGYFNEHIVGPMFDINKSILKQGLLFEMPESLVDENVLENTMREELEKNVPNFEQFLRVMGAQKKDGVVQGFVRHNTTGRMLAVRVKGDVFIDPATNTALPVSKSVKFELLSPFGEVISEADATVLANMNPEYTLLANRDPQRGQWHGDRDAAKRAWDQEISDNPRPDVLREYFEQAGIELPEHVRFVHNRKANMEEWSVRSDDAELYRIKRIVPVGEKTVNTPNGKVKQQIHSHSMYDPFKGKLMVYDAKQVRDPVYIYREKTPHKLWEPIENYFPHMIHWNEMSVESDQSGRYLRFIEYAEKMADIPENQMTFEEAKKFLAKRIHESKTKSYGNLEQDRQYHYPTYDRQYFQTWGRYLSRSGERLQSIREFGQKNDLLDAQLMQFVGEDYLGEDLTPIESSILKLRRARGYFDFLADKGGMGTPFIDTTTGKPLAIDPLEDAMQIMSPADWQVLLSEQLIRPMPDGTYMPTEAAAFAMETPAFVTGGMAKGLRQMSIAQDVVKNQLGWLEGNLIDEAFAEGINRVRSFVGAMFLRYSWATNIVQPVNTAITFGPQYLMEAIWDIAAPGNPAARKYNWEMGQEAGALAIDVLHDYAGTATWERRMLRQLLGATPDYQTGEFHPIKSYSFLKHHVEDPGIKTMAYSPFYAIEGFNRVTSALAARYNAAASLKRLITRPEKGAREMIRLTEMPHAPGLEAKLDAALSVPNLTTGDIDLVKKKKKDDVRSEMPHLYPVHEFLSEYSKEGADWMQHRVEAMDRGRPWSTNPIVLMLFHLQSFTMAQTKMIKDVIKREWKIAHAVLTNSMEPMKGLKQHAAAGALGTSWFLIKTISIAYPFGVFGNILGRLVRFQEPTEEDLTLMAALYRTGMMTMIGEALWQMHQYPHSSSDIMQGPTLGTLADFKQSPLKTTRRLLHPPAVGPSLETWHKWREGGGKPKFKPISDDLFGGDDLFGNTDDMFGGDDLFGASP